MNIHTTQDLREKEIINLTDGSKLGYATEFEVNVSCNTALITSLIISGDTGFLGFCKKEEIVIPWDKIECIGEDAILVRICLEECRVCPPKKHRFF